MGRGSPSRRCVPRPECDWSGQICMGLLELLLLGSAGCIVVCWDFWGRCRAASLPPGYYRNHKHVLLTLARGQDSGVARCWQISKIRGAEARLCDSLRSRCPPAPSRLPPHPRRGLRELLKPSKSAPTRKQQFLGSAAGAQEPASPSVGGAAAGAAVEV